MRNTGLPRAEKQVVDWSSDQGAINAQAIAADRDAGGQHFREVDSLYCDGEGHRRVIARIYVGRDDDGVVRHWVWVGPAKAGGPTPAIASHIPQAAGEPVVPLVAECPRCRAATLIVPGGNGLKTVAVQRLTSATRAVVSDD